MAGIPTVIHTQAKKQGYLSKGGKSLSGWKKRWFVLDDESLRYFTDNSVRKLRRKDSKEARQIEKEIRLNLMNLFSPSNPSDTTIAAHKNEGHDLSEGIRRVRVLAGREEALFPLGIVSEGCSLLFLPNRL